MMVGTPEERFNHEDLERLRYLLAPEMVRDLADLLGRHTGPGKSVVTFNHGLDGKVQSMQRTAVLPTTTLTAMPRRKAGAE